MGKRTLTVIPTTYRGIRFRSRLEARWAVFLDHAGIDWRYEQQGYKLSNGQLYLVDFWLPNQKYWIEVKGSYPTADEIAKAEGLVNDSYHVLFLFYGDIPERPDPPVNDSALCIGPHGIIDTQFWWCECGYCGNLEVQWQGHADRMQCGCHVERSHEIAERHDTPLLLNAYMRARSARFEHGEAA